MRSGQMYTHEYFMDVTFYARSVRYFGQSRTPYKVKLEWWVRGKPVFVTTKHELSLRKALEFRTTAWQLPESWAL